MAHGDAREGKWRGNWRMEWVASTLHTTSEHGVSNITTADVHNSAASSRLNWRPPADLNGLARFAERRKSGFCACAITFQTQSKTAEERNCRHCRPSCALCWIQEGAMQNTLVSAVASFQLNLQHLSGITSANCSPSHFSTTHVQHSDNNRK